MTEEKHESLMLKWNEEAGQFQPVKSDEEMNDGIFMDLNVEKKRWKYFYIDGASLISRRTALRSANGIAKTGYVHPDDNVRYGANCALKQDKDPHEDMPDNLRVAQRKWYKGEYKQY